MLNLSHAVGLMLHPKKEWQKISEQKQTLSGHFLGYVLILALIGPLAGFYGTTTMGWQIGAREAVKLTIESAATIAVLYYFATVFAVFGLGLLVKWMLATYCDTNHPTLAECVALAGYTATPIFLVGIVEAYPVLWLNFVIGLPALAYTVVLLYSGVPIMMKIPEERGFLMSSSLLALGLVALVSLLGLTALLWGWGFQPVFTN